MEQLNNSVSLLLKMMMKEGLEMDEIKKVIEECKYLDNNKSVIKFLKDRIIQIRKDTNLFYIYVVKGGVMTNSKEGIQVEELQEVLAEMWS